MFSRNPAVDGYSYYISQDSDDENNGDSSEEEKLDDVGLIFEGTAQQKRHAFKRLTSGEELSSSEDEFEEMMKTQLDCQMNAVESSWKKTDEGNKGGRLVGMSNKDEKVNDDLLYDPDADDEDQRWVDQHRAKIRKRMRPKKSSATTQGDDDGSRKMVDKRMKSDAVLNCAACMITLCLDCQRHSKYANQFRAMFVINCRVERGERLRFDKHKEKKKVFKRHRKQAQRERQLKGEQVDDNTTETSAEAPTTGNDEYYHPVKCEQCGTEVGVFDQDEVYHFFNVVESH